MENKQTNRDYQVTVLLRDIEDENKMLDLMNNYKSEKLPLPPEDLKSFAATQLMKNEGGAARQLFNDSNFKPSEQAVPEVTQNDDGTYSIEYDEMKVDKIPAEQVNGYAMKHVDSVAEFYKGRIQSNQAKLNELGYTQPTGGVATNDEKSQEKSTPTPVIVSQDDYLEGVSLLFVTPEDLKSELDNPDSEVSKSLAMFNNMSQTLIFNQEEMAKIANEVQKIEEEMEDIKQQYADQAQTEAVKKFWEAADGSQEQKDALKLLQEKIKAEDAARLQALNGAKAKLANATNNLNTAQTNLSKVLNEKVNIFAGELESDRSKRLAGIKTASYNNLAREEIKLSDMKAALAKLQPTDPKYTEQQAKIQQQEKVVGLQNKVINNALSYVHQQTAMLDRQKELRAPELRDKAFKDGEGAVQINLAEFDRSSVPGKSAVVSSIQYAKADQDERDFRERKSNTGRPGTSTSCREKS